MQCQPNKENEEDPINILWLVAEDLGPYIPPFGDSTVQTPNLSRLAREGVCYHNVFSISGVCSPSRAAIATGMYPTSIGAHHMRTLFQQPAAREMGIINYEVVLPPQVKMVSQIMREEGYYATNNAKEDYQFHPSQMAWDESSLSAHWRNRPAGKPFYSVFNFGVTHESNLWNPFPRTYDLDTFPPPRNIQWWKQFEGTQKPLYVPENLEVNIPPYLPNTNLVIQDIRRMYSNIVEMDRHVGVVLNQLEADGLLDNTIIVWYTDHGGPLPRQKRLLYDSGLKVPMIIRYPNQERAGEIEKHKISFIDFAPTLLSMAGIQPPDYIQGQAFEGPFASQTDRQYIHAAADRFDETYDMIRAVRNHKYKYLKNFNTDQPYYLPLAYRENMATMQELLRMRDEGTLNAFQKQWFRTTKPTEELFDLEHDPHELVNLADDPDYAEIRQELSVACAQWMEDANDMGFIPEEDLIRQFWPDKVQPTTANPIVHSHNGTVDITCKTEGATIGYKFNTDHQPWTGWRIYKNPIQIPEEQQIQVIAHRIGFAPSDTVTHRITE
ncbi:MAG: sulfatase-like hydrolase/transferase [Saprospiraceae bacterium]|nr:sulfatase-like hydrolase/transferase [Saprospiraceae bacterium]